LKRLIITILLMPLIVLGCANSRGVQQNQNSQEKVVTTPASMESTWATVPTPSKIVVYNEGKSRLVLTNDPNYNVLVKETDAVLKNSDLSSTKNMYSLAVLNGDISGYRRRSGVELIYNSPFDLTLRTSEVPEVRTIKVSVYRLFIYCDDKPMLWVGTKETDDYSGNGLGPLGISNTNSLKQLVNNLVNDATAKSN
jgi:hypothetical protein